MKRYKVDFLKMIIKPNMIFGAGKLIKNTGAGAIIAALTMIISGADLYAQNGCSTTGTERINQEIALCATHAYNIGAVTNPTTPAEKKMMEDVVALKATVMTQQIKKQYDYLDVTIKRFKVQLEKAILTSKMEAAGAESENSSYGSGGGNRSSGDKNIVLAGTENCNNKNTPLEVYACLRQNHSTIYQQSNAGQNLNIDLRKQLAKDYKISKDNGASAGYSDKPDSKLLFSETKNGNRSLDCTDYQATSSRTTFETCLNALNTDSRNIYSTLSNANAASKARQNSGY